MRPKIIKYQTYANNQISKKYLPIFGDNGPYLETLSMFLDSLYTETKSRMNEYLYKYPNILLFSIDTAHDNAFISILEIQLLHCIYNLTL